ncbi:MAG: LysM peptidoglycan-binding domain-containing protein [Bacteroidota bacterium]
MKRVTISLNLFVLLSLLGSSVIAQNIELYSGGSTSTESSNDQIHVVIKGESLYRIAKSYGTSVDDLKSANGLTSNIILPGQRLVIAAAEAVVDNGTTRSEVKPENDAVDYLTEETAAKRASFREEALAAIEYDAKYGSAPVYEDPASFRMRDRAVSVQNYDNDIPVEKKVYYEVRRGDNIYTIAEAYDVSVEQLRAWNGTNSVKEGDVIVVDRQYDNTNAASLRGQQASSFRSSRISDYSVDELKGRSADEPVNRRTVSNASEERTRDIYDFDFDQGNSTGSQKDQFDTGLDLGALIPEERAGNSRGENRRNFDTPQPTGPDQTQLGDFSENGSFISYEYPGGNREKYYAIHKRLRPGTRIKIAIPDNNGFLEVLVVGRMDSNSRASLGLSPATVKVLRSAGVGSSVRFFYD